MQDIARSLQDLEDAGGGNFEGGGKAEGGGGGGGGGIEGDVGFTTITAADDAIRDARALADPHPMWKSKESKGGDEGTGASSSSSASYDQHPCAALASTGSIEFYSPVKNNMVDAAAKARAGTSPASASAGEAAIYAASCKMLLALGCDVEAPVWCEWGKLDGDVDTRLTLPQWSRVVFAPRFAVGLQRLSTRFIQPGKVVVRQNATLVLDGSNVIFTDQLCVDGALVVTAVEGAVVEINGLVVRNEGWAMVPLGTDGEEEATHAESIRIRGFSLKKAQTCELVFSEPGKYVVSMAGGGGSAVRGSVSMEFTTPGEHFIESSSSSSSSSSSPGAPRGGEVDGMDGMSLDERILAVLQKANMAPASGVPPPPGVGGGGGGGGDGGGETKAGVDDQRFGSGDGEDGEDDEARIDHAKESGDAEGKDANGGKGAGEGDDPSSTARAAPSVEEQSSGVRIHESGKSIWADIGGKGDEMEMEKAVVATKTTDRMMKMGLGLDDEDKQKAMTLMQEELDASHALQPLAGMGLEGHIGGGGGGGKERAVKPHDPLGCPTRLSRFCHSIGNMWRNPPTKMPGGEALHQGVYGQESHPRRILSDSNLGRVLLPSIIEFRGSLPMAWVGRPTLFF